MNTRTFFRRSVATAVVTAFLAVQQGAQACPGCRQSVGMGDGASGSYTVNLIGVGYGLSILFLLLTVAGIVSGLVYMMYRNCQAIAARQNAMLAEEEAQGFGGSLPAVGHA